MFSKHLTLIVKQVVALLPITSSSQPLQQSIND